MFSLNQPVLLLSQPAHLLIQANRFFSHLCSDMNVQVDRLCKGAVTYHRIALTDAERIEKMQKCLSGGESRLGGDEGRRGK